MNPNQSDGIQQLAQWLFKDYYDTFTEPAEQAVIGTFIKNFILKYQNREIWHIKKEVFRSTLYYDLNKYREYLKNIPNEYEQLFNASVTLDQTTKTTDNTTDSGTIKDTGTVNDTGTLNSTDQRTAKNTTTDTGTVDTTYDGTNDRNMKRTPDLTTTSNNSGGTSGRNIGSDYPQSNVSQGTDPTFSWKYASVSQDNTSSHNDNTTTTNTGNEVTDDLQTVNSTQKQENNLTNDSSLTDNNTRTGNTTNLRTNDLTRTSQDTKDRTVNTTVSKDGISQFDKVLALLDYLDKNPYQPIFKIIEKLDKHFISMYVDEERDLYIDPSTDILKLVIGA